jgi:hypothetical protein
LIIQSKLILIHIKFERQNKKIILNIYDCDDKEIYPLYISKRSKTEETTEVDLIIFHDKEKHHYALINNFSRLMSHLTKDDGQTYWCKKCLHRFSREDLLINHDEDCVKPQKTVMPEKDSTTSFKNYQKQMPIPFTIYADFESWLEKPENLTLYSDEELQKLFEGLISQNRLPKDMLIKIDKLISRPINKDKSVNEICQLKRDLMINKIKSTISTEKTKLIAKHKPLSVGYKVVCRDDHEKSKPYKQYIGENAAERLVQELVKEANEIEEIYTKGKVPMKELSEEYYNAKECHICNGKMFTGFSKFCTDHKCDHKCRKCIKCEEKKKMCLMQLL